jgi:hypothetical protein
MPTPEMSDDETSDDQDQAETFDETHFTPDGEDIANFDDIPVVKDFTSEVADAEEADEEWDDEADNQGDP